MHESRTLFIYGIHAINAFKRFIERLRHEWLGDSFMRNLFGSRYIYVQPPYELYLDQSDTIYTLVVIVRNTTMAMGDTLKTLVHDLIANDILDYEISLRELSPLIDPDPVKHMQSC